MPRRARRNRKLSKSDLEDAYQVKESPETKAKFLEVLAGGGTIREARLAVGAGRTTVYSWRERDEVFAKAWDQAVEDGVDLLEAEARRRGRDGIDRGIYHAGERVDTEKQYSDSLLTMMLKGRRAAVYNTDRVEHTGKDGAPIMQSLTVEFVSASTKGKK